VGIDAISFRDVGRLAGLTHGALYARFEDVEELLVDLWNEVLCHRAIALFESTLEAAARPTAASVAQAFDFIRLSSPADIAMVEVLLTSRRFDILHEEVETFIRDYLESNTTEVTGGIQSRALTFFSLIMMEILVNAQIGLEGDNLNYLESVVIETLQVPPGDVRKVTLHEPTDRRIALPENDLRSQLAYYTFGAVGRSGYTRATISRISRRANCSPGVIYKMYPSKEDLVIAAIRRIMAAPWISMKSLAEILDEGTLTQLLYSSASVENSVRKNFTLEIAMASAHHEKIRASVKSQLEGLETLVPLLINLGDRQRDQLRYVIRSIVFLTLGVSFLSTVTKATDQIDFNQFAEPFRRALLNRISSAWGDIKSQLQHLVLSTDSV
jgi:AcrR family transcriptional regulator